MKNLWKAPPHFALVIILACSLWLNPVITSAGVVDNTGASTVTTLLGQPKVNSGDTLFGMLYKILSKLSKLDTLATSAQVNALSAQVASLNTKIDDQTAALSALIKQNAAPASKPLPTGNKGDEFTVGGYTFYILSASSDTVRCMYKGSVGGAPYEQVPSAAANTSTQPCQALSSVYTVSRVSNVTGEDVGNLTEAMLDSVGGQIVCGASNGNVTTVSWWGDSAKYNGFVSFSCHDNPVAQFYNIYRK